MGSLLRGESASPAPLPCLCSLALSFSLKSINKIFKKRMSGSKWKMVGRQNPGPRLAQYMMFSLISGQSRDGKEPPRGYGPHLLLGCLNWSSSKMGVDQTVLSPWISQKLRKTLRGPLVQKTSHQEERAGGPFGPDP